MKKNKKEIHPWKVLNMELVTEIVAHELLLEVKDIMRKGRSHYKIQARAMCFNIIHKTHGYHFVEIGGFYDMDHASVYHGINTHKQLYEQNYKGYKLKYDNVKSEYLIRINNFLKKDDSSTLYTIYDDFNKIEKQLLIIKEKIKNEIIKYEKNQNQSVDDKSLQGRRILSNEA